MITKKLIADSVKLALAEDLNNKNDITALLIPKKTTAKAKIITKEAIILCGKDWGTEVFKQLNKHIKITWKFNDGDKIAKNQVICHLQGDARSLVTGERTALNFLQFLSGTATQTYKYVQNLKNSPTKLLDTRKTIPGHRIAQKYAVKCGGGKNHRMGLYDAFLIKENHIKACGSITKAIQAARKISTKLVEVEVKNLTELREALAVNANIIMLDNFSLTNIRKALTIRDNTNNKTKIEVSGNIKLNNINAIAKTHVDYISIGALTKNIQAADLTMLF